MSSFNVYPDNCRGNKRPGTLTCIPGVCVCVCVCHSAILFYAMCVIEDCPQFYFQDLSILDIETLAYFMVFYFLTLVLKAINSTKFSTSF